MKPVVDIDRPESYVRIVDQAMRAALSEEAYHGIGREKLEYIDDSASVLQKYGNQSLIYKGVNDAFRGTRIILSHATRLSSDALSQIELTGLQPLRVANRVKELEARVAEYANSNGLGFSKQRFDELVDEHLDRDDGRVFFSLSRDFHRRDCSEYLHFGSEFEVVIVVHYFSGREARSLLKQNTQPAFVHWVAAMSDVIEFLQLDEISDILERGNYPEFPNHVLDRWLLWRVSRVNDIKHLDGDYTVTFRTPFPSVEQTIELVDEATIAPHQL